MKNEKISSETKKKNEKIKSQKKKKKFPQNKKRATKKEQQKKQNKKVTYHVINKTSCKFLITFILCLKEIILFFFVPLLQLHIVRSLNCLFGQRPERNEQKVNDIEK